MFYFSSQCQYRLNGLSIVYSGRKKKHAFTHSIYHWQNQGCERIKLILAGSIALETKEQKPYNRGLTYSCSHQNSRVCLTLRPGSEMVMGFLKQLSKRQTSYRQNNSFIMERLAQNWKN